MQHHPNTSRSLPSPLSRPAFLRMPAVVHFTSLGRSTIYRLMAEAKFPRSVRLCGRTVAWRQSDLERLSEERAASH